MILLLRLTLLACLPTLLFAHSMSMSNGELRLEGQQAVLSIQIPDYEVQQVENRETVLLDAFTLLVEGVALERTEGSCAANAPQASYDCISRFALPEGASVVEVECDLPGAVVPNHVHVLRAVSSAGAEQQVFDYALRRHSFRFQAMGAGERLFTEMRSGAVRVLLGPAQLLFLFALVLAARNRRELLRMTAAFLAVLAATAVATLALGWQPPPGFVDSAAALTIAYIAVETLALPEARGRWLVAGGLGAFHGLYFGVFLQQAPMWPAAVLSGVFIACLFVLVLIFGTVERLPKDFRESLFRKIGACSLCIIGIGWFIVRLI